MSPKPIVTYARALEHGGVEVLVWEPQEEGWYVPILRRSDKNGVWWSEIHIGNVTAMIPAFATDIALAMARRSAW